MTLEKQYTKEEVLKYLQASKQEGRERTLKEIYESLKCSERTAWELLKPLIDGGKVQRRNAGSEKKPTWLYSVS